MVRKNELEVLQNKVRSGQHRIWKPPEDITFTDSLQYVKEFTSETEESDESIQIPPELFPDTVINCKKVTLQLNQLQKDIITRWCYAYVKMYNETIYFIKRKYLTENITMTNYQQIRTHHLKTKRNEIISESIHSEHGANSSIRTHMIDEAIKLACSNYKSALSNLKAKNITHFRVRYWKRKLFYRLDIEPSYFTDAGFCTRLLGPIEAYYNNIPFEWSTVNNTSQLQFDFEDNKYYLIVPEKSNTIKSKNVRRKWISLDPGIRTFLTGISTNQVVKFADNLVENEIVSKFNKIDTLCKLEKEKTLKKRRARKALKRVRKKIKNKIDDMHWKTINYLVKNYETVLIGDLSAKRVISNKGSVLSSISKRSLLALSLFKYHQRLSYKAQQYHTKVILVDESFTTKVCSCCGEVNGNIGSKKVFECYSCPNISDRDVDGARCIAIKGLL